ncbi:STAS/SEC14 domain-containing protein [Chondromyces crocatus]|uniref:STAS domain-containing protein n=1 Tax=Chondromyces crocatus TaxID=52 RepID=A0A0K1ETC2_CHOCO|nr:STAS/SEC14 domain-containing protein [Chondromyces crocatus]AKT43902.1 uncharacterized protein CMC5_081390 [Chondromyces crocatus]
MSLREAPRTTPAPWNFQLSWLHAGVLELSFHGRLGAEEIEAAADQIATMTRNTRLDSLLIDLDQLDGYTSHAGSSGGRLVLLARERGAREVVFVAPSDKSRMITASVAFGVQQSVKIFATRAEARQHLRT